LPVGMIRSSDSSNQVQRRRIVPRGGKERGAKGFVSRSDALKKETKNDLLGQKNINRPKEEESGRLRLGGHLLIDCGLV